VEVVTVAAAADGRVDLRAALAALGAREVNEVLAECGPRLAGALLQAGVVDEIVAFVAPGLLGHEARALAELPGIATLDQRLKLRFTDARMVGADLRITAVPA
jgi:diaminohydroxyphosphoribosylaminopyrimidine deaminase / 5-amino-6-(5-phosphoribosylamino)uracil reductase